MASLDSIWDEPATEVSQVVEITSDDELSAPKASKRPRAALFLSDSDEDVDIAGPSRQARGAPVPPPPDIDIDALFADIDDDDLNLAPLPARIDEAAATREAEARHRRNMPASTLLEILPSGSPSRDNDGSPNKRSEDKGNDEKKARRKIFKLDENRLLGPNGFPQLIKMTKDFRIKGKGHEATDLNRILQTYQYWSHQLYPKTQFRDTVERVEKLTHSRRMNVALSVWRDEAHGVQRKGAEDDDNNEDLGHADQADDELMDTDDLHPRPRSSSVPSSRVSSPPATSEAENDGPLRPTVEAPNAASQHGEEDEDEAFWRSMDDFGGDSFGAHAAPPAPVAPRAPVVDDDDDDMWDIINEMEQSTAVKSAAPSAGPAPPASPMPVIVPVTGEPEPDDDWDDMYV
ncbi:hypothetical protein HYPSUDRAFT_35226 [Hypholoma sublateritium FD-334 SS-4]|uniref:Chromosome segregation in meiosis protein n=1 Tax=Hypholoma sublateritium (strain FD-334 SS-4) TaxID=945553 RepID=A0A0D2PFM5_HYPSF|nr:hypothetical protein HYPSUDRAFT_35226 [Hypholoma sublateritium FD-334 SS-4]